MKNVITNQFRNESLRLEEWILYHFYQGFDSFILFDDWSEDNSIEIIDKLRSKYKINIIIEKTDGKGVKFKNGSETNLYQGNGDVNWRIARSATRGLEIARRNNPDCNIFIGEVDEFLHTPLDIKITDLIQELQIKHGQKHLYIQSFDICDNFELNSNILTQPCTQKRWSYEYRQRTKFNDRGKSITTPSVTSIVREEGGHIHYLTTGLKHEFPDCKRVNWEILRIHHFRKPSYIPVWNEFDPTLYNKAKMFEDLSHDKKILSI